MPNEPVSDSPVALAAWSAPRGEAPPTLSLGTMNFGKRTPSSEAARIVARAVDLGITLFDTANAYGDGESERILGRALRGRRDAVHIATKVGFGRVHGKSEGLSGARVRAALDESLARLGTDHVDIYYLHVPDPATPILETLSALKALRNAGKLLHFGVSNYASWQILEIMTACDALGMPRPVIAQQLYNLLIRQLDLEYFRFARRHPIHTTVYNALAGGLLSGRYRPGDAIASGSRFEGNRLYQRRYWSDRFLELTRTYEEVARDEGMSLVELAYAWLAGAASVDSILVGPGSVEHLDAAVAACTKSVSPEARARIDGIHAAFTGTDTSYAR